MRVNAKDVLLKKQADYRLKIVAEAVEGLFRAQQNLEGVSSVQNIDERADRVGTALGLIKWHRDQLRYHFLGQARSSG